MPTLPTADELVCKVGQKIFGRLRDSKGRFLSTFQILDKFNLHPRDRLGRFIDKRCYEAGRK